MKLNITDNSICPFMSSMFMTADQSIPEGGVVNINRPQVRAEIIPAPCIGIKCVLWNTEYKQCCLSPTDFK